MLLHSLTLKNIRSYQDQTINFPESSTLLSGDIGSGKSTILLAIEFALFGISKPDLTGETLLRKGETKASVELSFQIENQFIQIKRNLKKTSKAISQTAGYLILNQKKQELTPLELKTQIINLLQYPEELITKSKNYIFRYTLYCPQEEMRLILQENPDNRLDILRKIFNLDKYKKIRENLWFYLKELRTKLTVLKTKTQPLPEKKSRLEELRNQQTLFDQEFRQLLPKLSQLEKQFQTQKSLLQETEQKNQLHQKLKSQLLNLNSLLKEKSFQQQALKQKQNQLKEEIQEIILPQTPEELKSSLQQLQEQQLSLLSQSSTLTTQISHCQQQVQSLQIEISQLTKQLSELEKKQPEAQILEKELRQKEPLQRQKRAFEDHLDQLKQSLHQNQLLLKQAEDIKSQLLHLDQCPTCLQKVPEEHKKNIFQKEQQKIQQAQNRINELEKNKALTQKQFLEANRQFDSLLKKENYLIKLQAELKALQEKQTQSKEKKTALQEFTKENNHLIKKLSQLKPEYLPQLKQQIMEKQELLQKVIQKKELEKNLAYLDYSLKELSQQIDTLTKEKQQTETELSQNPDLTELLQKQKQTLEELSEKEKTLLSHRTKIQTQQENLQQQLDSLLKEIDQLNKFKSYLNRLTELHYWLEEFFVKLTYTIEKQILLNIYHLFNALFQEWFSLLIDDESFSARLDDSFSPIIEQNGYEIFFSNLSGGERTAASLAYRLALNKVINDIIHQIRTKDLLILDEPTDGFSSEQLDKVRDVLEKLNLRQTLIVSHETKIESFVENVIRINKSEGVSRII